MSPRAKYNSNNRITTLAVPGEQVSSDRLWAISSTDIGFCVSSILAQAIARKSPGAVVKCHL